MKKEILHGLKNIYGQNGHFIPGSWKEDSDKKFSDEDARIVYRNLQKNGFIPTSKKAFVFLSPTANLPTHETAMWDEDCKTRTAPNLFIAGDLQFPPGIGNLSQFKADKEPSQSIHQVRLNAFYLPFQDGTVNLIWDRKGWVWHCTTTKDKTLINDTFREYGRVLKEGGSIVLDAIPGFKRDRYRMIDLRGKQVTDDYEYGRKPKFRPRDLFVGEVQQYEESTLDMINQQFPFLGLELAADFSVHLLGEGKHRICVLTK